MKKVALDIEDFKILISGGIVHKDDVQFILSDTYSSWNQLGNTMINEIIKLNKNEKKIIQN